MQAYISTGALNSLRRVRQDIIMEVLKRYRAEGIDFAFPSQSLYITNEN